MTSDLQPKGEQDDLAPQQTDIAHRHMEGVGMNSFGTEGKVTMPRASGVVSDVIPAPRHASSPAKAWSSEHAPPH